MHAILTKWPLNRSREVGNKTDSLVAGVAGVKAEAGVGGGWVGDSKKEKKEVEKKGEGINVG